MRDRSLDEFLNVDDDGDDRDRDVPPATDETGDTAEDVEAGETAVTEQRPDASDGVEPATATAVWGPDGGACANCGSSARRRWQSEQGLVCGTCKEW